MSKFDPSWEPPSASMRATKPEDVDLDGYQCADARLGKYICCGQKVSPEFVCWNGHVSTADRVEDLIRHRLVRGGGRDPNISMQKIEQLIADVREIIGDDDD